MLVDDGLLRTSTGVNVPVFSLIPYVGELKDTEIATKNNKIMIDNDPLEEAIELELLKNCWHMPYLFKLLTCVSAPKAGH